MLMSGSAFRSTQHFLSSKWTGKIILVKRVSISFLFLSILSCEFFASYLYYIFCLKLFLIVRKTEVYAERGLKIYWYFYIMQLNSRILSIWVKKSNIPNNVFKLRYRWKSFLLKNENRKWISKENRSISEPCFRRRWSIFSLSVLEKLY